MRAAQAARPCSRFGAAGPAISIAVAHQKGGVGKSTTAALLAAEIAWLRPNLRVVVEVRMEPMSVQALGIFLPRLRALQDGNAGAPRLAGFVATHYVGRVREHHEALEDLETFAAQQGAVVLGVIPFVAAVGMGGSTPGHHYRATAERLLDAIG